MSAHDVTALSRRLDELAEEPVAAHPAALDEVHRTLVTELERLAGVVAGDGGADVPGSHSG